MPYNDAGALAAAFDRFPGEIAAFIVEPLAANMGVVPPRPGYLEAVRELTRRHGALLVFDEVITGFRLAAGGAQELYGVLPDLTTLGKILGGGSRRRLRRPARADVPDGAVGAGLPGRARSRGILSRWRPASRCSARSRGILRTRRWKSGAAGSRKASGRP